MTDEAKLGDRIVLEHTDDPYTKLRPGDRGQVTGIRFRETVGETEISVRWDSGSSLTLIPAAGDRFHVVAEGE